ncbi:MAG: hypothetical protein IPO17_00505 [Flavobacteriales bacterium]|nr:hypothetical protein [Flavobacteriales bacterium]MBK9193476.1 hypothetical protein [Flavobacteriales bacterium]
MKNIAASLVLVSLFAACAIEENPIVQTITPGCGTDGNRFQADLGGADFCAEGSLVAVAGEGALTINGLALNGVSLTLQIDSLQVGLHESNEANNNILLMEQGQNYTVGPGGEGTITITSHDEISNSVTGSFEAGLLNVQSGVQRSVSGSFEVIYTTQQ